MDNCFFVIQSSKENERIKRNSSSSNNARSKETKKSAKENGSFTSPYNTSNKQNVTIDKVKIKSWLWITYFKHFETVIVRGRSIIRLNHPNLTSHSLLIIRLTNQISFQTLFSKRMQQAKSSESIWTIQKQLRVVHRRSNLRHESPD